MRRDSKKFDRNFVLFLDEEDEIEGEDDENLSTPNATVLISGNTVGNSSTVENSTTTSGVLRSKDLRSVVEKKRRNFSRSRSSSDSEDNGSNYDMTRSTSRKQQTRSPTRPSSFQESADLPSSLLKQKKTSKTLDFFFLVFFFQMKSSDNPRLR